jgi:ATP-dependent 26S proteasome regulatory subunit
LPVVFPVSLSHKSISTINRELLKPSSSVALHRHSNALVDVLPPEADSSIQVVSNEGKPDVSYADIGGLDIQKQEIREAVELPLTNPELYSQIGIDPPRGVLLYGPPGTGKTMLAKAVAHHTDASFIRVVGSEFVQKYLGEGPRMVRDVFRLGSCSFWRRSSCFLFIVLFLQQQRKRLPPLFSLMKSMPSPQSDSTRKQEQTEKFKEFCLSF